MTLDALSLWIISGIVLLISEILTGGFFLLFIALGCFSASLVAALGQSTTTQFITCAVVAVAGSVVLRRPIQKRLLQTTKIQADIGKEIRVDQSIEPHKQVAISYQGSSWMATNLDSIRLEKGDRVVIVGIDGTTLLLRKAN